VHVAGCSKFALAFVVPLARPTAFVWGCLPLLPQQLCADSQSATLVLFVVLAGTLAGFLSPIAPGGIGVLEAVIAIGLGKGDALAPVTLSAVLSRVLTIATEFVPLGWVLLRIR
jgi:uncharacterized membrane protein YbhN (UPF0104 family)